MSQPSNFSFQGEESQIRELLNVFKETILKTAQDTILLESKFDSDLKQKLKPKLQKHMKNLVELDARLSNEKQAASEANNDINEAYRAYNDRNTLAFENEEDPLPEEPVEFDENGEPMYEWPPASWNDSPARQNFLRILEDDNFDIFSDHLTKIKATQRKNKSDPRIKNLKNLLSQKESNDDVEDEDDEPIASEVESIPIDPITKKKIQNPVKNTKCGHIYDKNSIDTYMKSNNPRCPYIGCVNRAPIRPDDVVNDEETRLKIEYLMALEDNESDDE